VSLHRYNPRRDRTEPAILQALHRVGARYLTCDPFDVLVLFRGAVFMLECKTEKGRPTRTQELLLAEGWPVVVVRTPAEALRAIGAT